MAQVNRLVPTNVGLLDVRNRSRRFSMHVGADVTEGFPVAEAQTKTKTNIFAYGYEDGSRVSIGASLKGRVWSYRVASTLKEWVDWCDHVGTKLTDEGISVDEVMRNFIRPKVVEERPPHVVIGLEWPWQIYLNLSDELRVEARDSSSPMIDVDLRVAEPSAEGPVAFQVATADWTLDYILRFDAGELIYAAVGTDAEVTTQRKSTSLSEFLNKNGLTLHLDQDAIVVPPGLLLKPDRTLPPFDSARVTPLDWTDVKLNVESQGPDRRPESVQARVIDHVAGLADWAIILDDDGTGEIADIVAMRIDGDLLRIHLTHCKYVEGGKPRAQVADLYELCGQAQKSVTWRRNVPRLFDMLLRRERLRLARGAPSGFMKGDAAALYELADRSQLLRPDLTIAVAQPGLSATSASGAQLELLASTETYVHETVNGAFDVYCSP